MISPFFDQQYLSQELNKLETTITDKINKLKHIIEDNDKEGTQEIISHRVLPQKGKPSIANQNYDPHTNYYQEFWKMYLINQILISKIKQYSIDNRLITQEIDALDETEKKWTELYQQKIKRKKRRPASQIMKNYKCPFAKCDKIYGSDVSLNLHMKIKHNSGTKTQRENVAKEIIQAEKKGRKIEVNLTLPPGYLDKFKESLKNN